MGLHANRSRIFSVCMLRILAYEVLPPPLYVKDFRGHVGSYYLLEWFNRVEKVFIKKETARFIAVFPGRDSLFKASKKPGKPSGRPLLLIFKCMQSFSNKLFRLFFLSGRNPERQIQGTKTHKTCKDKNTCKH